MFIANIHKLVRNDIVTIVSGARRCHGQRIDVKDGSGNRE